ncbi:hypothetical protein [Mesoterricola silvestris]|uniref:HEAT repeat domain-containing protein n=1 Tax=Mesoterricola silvestris TaxID=2927979 RepID=A0AA48KB36_9BACT|nr:hypothetical protein [Mesoterricola silvestris]BDU72128.1 hypothetical protein METEAL_13020 [Mesoterricola silvestris]
MASKALDQFRTVLDHLDGDDREDQLAFFRCVLSTGPEAVEELDGRLPGSRAPRALRQLVMEASFYFPWPDWLEILSRMLRYEAELPIFETGARALGRIGSPGALEVLRELNTMRQGAEFKEILAQVLAQTDPQEAFQHYLGRLLEGSANPGAANEAAQRLVPLVSEANLEALRVVAQHPDLLVFRHGLLLLALIPTAEAAEVLADLCEDSHNEVLSDRLLKAEAGAYRSLAPPAAREQAQEALAAAGSGGGLEVPPVVKALREDILAATEESSKAGALSGVITQALEAVHQRSRRLSFAVDTSAEGLAAHALKGRIDRDRVLDLLVTAYREQTGREGLARALARLVPADAPKLHDLLLEGPDGAQRAAAVEVLGGREEAALQGVLLRACGDPLTDIADRALFHLGRLPGARDLARTLMGSGAPQDLSLGLRLAAQGRFPDLVPDLLDLVRTSTREETTLQVVETLGAVGGAEAAEPLLEMLHSGQSLRLQTAVGLALQGQGDPAVALALCAKADAIKLPVLHCIAVEALGTAHGAAGPALPARNGPMLLHQVRGAWMDRNPWALRLRVVNALAALQLTHPEIWSAVVDLLRDTLVEKRPAGAWTPDDLHAVQAAQKEFMRRAAAPGEG